MTGRRPKREEWPEPLSGGLMGQRTDDISVAGLLESRRTDILRRLERRLCDTGNDLAKDPVVLPACIARADAILTTTVSELGRTPDDDAAPGGSGVLMDVVLDELLQVAAQQPERLPQMSAVLASLHSVLATQAQAAGDTYDSYILRTTDEARRRERRQLAQEIHDELGHELSIAKHQLELSELYQATEPAAAASRTTSAREHLESAMLIVRRLIVEFADNRSRVDLEQEIVSFADVAGGWRTAVHVRVGGDQLVVPNGHRHHLFLIIREALLNVFAHADADKAVVLVDVVPVDGSPDQVITAVVEDNGTGFEPASVDRGFGLVSMRERAESLGGGVTVASSAAGTRVEVRLPLP